MFDTALNELINIIEQNTDASININPDFFNGSCLQVEGHDEVYIVMSGKKRHIPNKDTYNGIFLNWNKIIKITGKAGPIWKAVVDSIPNGDALTSGALLIKSKTSDPVYLLTNNKKYYVNNPAEFNSCNFDWNKISSYPQIVIDAIPEGKKTCLCLQINLNLNYLLKSEPVGFG